MVRTIKLPDGYYTQPGGGGEETMKELFRVHFPDSAVTDVSNDGQGQLNLEISKYAMNRGECHLVRNVINQSEIRWVLDILQQFKSAGIDKILPALLQQGAEQLVPYLCHVFRTCMAYGFIPMAWKQATVTFIPKPGKSDFTEARAYCPISLSSFLLKTTEKLADRHIRDGVLKQHQLN